MRDRANVCPCQWHHRELREQGHCKCHLFVAAGYSPETAYLPERNERITSMRSVREREVTVYCTSWCPHSRRAKALLESYHIPYRNIDIERDAAAAEQVEAWNNGYRSVPTIITRLIVTEPSDSDLQHILLESRARLMACTAYVTQWCPDCRRTIAWLGEQSIPCTTIDIDSNAQAADQVRVWNKGSRSVPTLELTLRLTEPSMEQLEAMVGLGG